MHIRIICQEIIAISLHLQQLHMDIIHIDWLKMGSSILLDRVVLCQSHMFLSSITENFTPVFPHFNHNLTTFPGTSHLFKVYFIISICCFIIFAVFCFSQAIMEISHSVKFLFIVQWKALYQRLDMYWPMAGLVLNNLIRSDVMFCQEIIDQSHQLLHVHHQWQTMLHLILASGMPRRGKKENE